MFRKIISIKLACNGNIIRCSSSSSSSSSRFDIYASVIVERKPLVAPPMNIIEKTMNTIQLRYEQLRSIYSNHEMRHFSDLERQKRLSSGKNVDEEDLDASSLQTAQEFEDESSKELKEFLDTQKNAKSVADNVRSVDRHLEKHLILVCKFRLGDQFVWALPMQPHQTGESLVETGTRCLSGLLNEQSDLRLKFRGNAPCSVHKFVYPNAARRDAKIGGHIFFLKVDYLSGTIDERLLKNIGNEKSAAPFEFTDYAWLTRAECANKLNKKYWKSIERSMFMDQLQPNTVEKIVERIREKFADDQHQLQSRAVKN